MSLHPAKLVTAPSKAEVPSVLHPLVVDACRDAIQQRGVFTMALSGGSLPSFLSSLPETFQKASVNAHFEKWHVLLADERCVASTHPDSNLGALRHFLLSKVPIPPSQVYGIDQDVLQQQESVDDAAALVAAHYGPIVREVLSHSGGQLDLAVLGFGPDGHTCSLFPGHKLLQEDTKFVASLTDSPKPPPQRITLTLPLLNTKTRCVVFCGAGSSKAPILQQLFASLVKDRHEENEYHVELVDSTPLPCGMVRPQHGGSLVYVCDADAMEGLSSSSAANNMTKQTAAVLPAKSKETLPIVLNEAIVEHCQKAMEERNAFTIALSGGSLPSFLSSLPETFEAKGVDPHFEKWIVLLADERCVPSTHEDSNLGALKQHVFNKIPQLAPSQMIGINEAKLATTEEVASDYEFYVRTVLAKSGNMLDLAVLGFGPDGHTCSLFPHHGLLLEDTKWVASIEDSPKPPSKRITLTLPLLNDMTRHVVFCGAGSSKAPVLQSIFSSLGKDVDGNYVATMTNPPPYPCGMVRPQNSSPGNNLTFICDVAALEGVPLAKTTISPPTMMMQQPQQPYAAKLVPAKSKETLDVVLNEVIVEACQDAIRKRGVFTIALSGGSLPAFLSTLPHAFGAKRVNPHFDQWFVLLADERCVPSTDKDSNLGALRQHFLNRVPQIPSSQVIGINEAKFASTADVASDYEFYVRTVLAKSANQLDLAVLGFGPDGHTCSLFPGHELLKEDTKWVAPIEDSPKPPPKRITLTLPMLNQRTRRVVFCGAGSSKAPILKSIFDYVIKGKDGNYETTLADPPPYPCGMVRPNDNMSGDAVTFVCDVAALEGVNVVSKRPPRVAAAAPKPVVTTKKEATPAPATNPAPKEPAKAKTKPAKAMAQTKPKLQPAAAPSMKMDEPYVATLIPAKSKDLLDIVLNQVIVDRAVAAVEERGVFTVALSGGSLPAFLSTMKHAFAAKKAEPNFEKWHILLADERCVHAKDKDSNLGALRQHLLSKIPQIRRSQVHGINEDILAKGTAADVASDYEAKVKKVLGKSGGQLDLAVLGFGPDGHTCSLFPGHDLLKEHTKLVASIEDSPKPPPKRITLTFPVLNSMTRHVVFCGAGGSKAPVLQSIFTCIYKGEDGNYNAPLASPAPLPCGMVRPSSGDNNTLTFVCDVAALEGANVVKEPPPAVQAAATQPAAHPAKKEEVKSKATATTSKKPTHETHVPEKKSVKEVVTKHEETKPTPTPKPAAQALKAEPRVADLIPAKSKETIGVVLNEVIVKRCHAAVEKRGVFTIALSGGSLPGFLSDMKQAFDAKRVSPHFDKWFVLLADERCVTLMDKDSNLGALREHFFSRVSPIPINQVFGINEDLLTKGTAADIASDYEGCVRTVLAKSGGLLDLAVLGFGPDGHTCSLFPDHELLKEDTKWVESIDDSPKPPPKRITLTLPFLNSKTRHVVFCGAGSSKAPVLQSIFTCVNKKDGYTADMTTPPPLPCGMVRPNTNEDGEDNTLTFVVDVAALEGVRVMKK